VFWHLEILISSILGVSNDIVFSMAFVDVVPGRHRPARVYCEDTRSRLPVMLASFRSLRHLDNQIRPGTTILPMAIELCERFGLDILRYMAVAFPGHWHGNPMDVRRGLPITTRFVCCEAPWTDVCRHAMLKAQPK
jgi:hypothetical protein